MQTETEERVKKIALWIAREAARALICYIAFILTGNVIGKLFAYTGIAIAKTMFLSPRVVYIVASLAICFAPYSISRAFELYDRSAQEAFVRYSVRRYKIAQGFGILFKDRILGGKLAVHLITYLALAAALPWRLGFEMAVRAFIPEGAIAPGIGKLISIGVAVPVIFIVVVLAKTSAHKWWVIAGEAERERILHHRHPKLRLFLEVLKIFVIYAMGFYVLPSSLMLIVSAILMVSLFRDVRIWIGLAAFILLIASIRRTRALVCRAKLVRRLKRSCKVKGYVIKAMHAPVLRALLDREGADVVFEGGGEIYYLKIVSSVRRASPMYISPEGIVSARHTYGFMKFEFFHVMTDVLYAFDAPEGAKKLVVFAPLPRKLFFNFGRTDTKPDDGLGGFNTYTGGAHALVGMNPYASSGSHTAGTRFRGPGYVSDVERGIIKHFQTGDKVGEYKFFNPDGLISGIDNDCLDR